MMSLRETALPKSLFYVTMMMIVGEVQKYIKHFPSKFGDTSVRSPPLKLDVQHWKEATQARDDVYMSCHA